MLCPGIDSDHFDEIIQIATQYTEVKAGLGIHPNDVTNYAMSYDDLFKAASHPEVIAIGETGLDYYRDESDKLLQQEQFIMHIAVAKALNKPGELKSIDSIKVTSAESPNNYFIGSESSRRIQIDSILISESGKNWISNWNLPAQPNTISMSIYSTWDFTFKEELLPELTQNKASQ